jgi:hypothetical protein
MRHGCDVRSALFPLLWLLLLIFLALMAIHIAYVRYTPQSA